MNNSEKKQTPQTALWESWKHVAPGMLKRINGGNLNGKTDINPIWRFRALTEAFGPCGLGWTIREVERWTSEAAGEIGAFVKVELRINFEGTWSEPIEGTGGSKLCGKGRGDGLNDEAWKMATTDAISVACKSLGMAADVYTGIQTHEDADQKKSGGDYSTKYEQRNYGTSRPAPAPAPRPQTGGGAVVPENPDKKYLITLPQVTTGRCGKIIDKLATFDYEDRDAWQSGLALIFEKYDVEPDALKEIEKRAVNQRIAAQDEQAKNALR